MEEKYRNSGSQFEDMQRWFAYLRRHNANFFDALFLDKDHDIGGEDIEDAVRQVADFFGLPMPIIRERADVIAEVITSDRAEECQIFYDLQEMEKSGINNREALKLAFLHEMSHQFLCQTHFMLFENELWTHELAADMLVGAYSTIEHDVATGKYKYMLRQLSASITHPNGKLRAAIVEYGRAFATTLKQEQRLGDINDVLKGLPAFVYGHYKELQEAWSKVLLDDEEESAPAKASPIDYESLPDTNLLKQYLLKHKEMGDDIG